MSFKHRINNALAAILPNNTIFAEYYNRGGGKKVPWERQADVPNAKEIKDWKNAVMSATDPDNPRRGELMRFYKNLLLDNHLASVIDTRILRVQRSSFKLIDENGNENEELKQLLERPWFEELVRLVLMSRFQGTTLIEMFDLDTDSMELERVGEVPQSNFIAQQGEIINREYDIKGAGYKKGVLKDYYLQIAGDWDLGMLNQLAMIILAKKLGLGSWMSYIDKFGIPPIFAITDRMDSGRLEELHEMMTNFRMNQFAILHGNEKIEIPSNYNVDAHNTFQALIENICNKEISKRVLGGTAMADEKSFVGSAEVQERVAADRYEADKLLFKFIFNSKIRQRLTKISPVYKDFEHCQLIWDNQETLDINGYIDAVQKLSSAFEFDIEEIRTRTGLPITGHRQAASPFLATTKETDNNDNGSGLEKKKTETRGLAHFNLFAATWDAAIQRLAEQIYEGKIKPADLDKDMVLKTYDRLSKSAAKGWGKGFYDHDIARKIRENLLQFSGAKTNRMLEEIASLKQLNLKMDEYLQEAKKISGRHNEQWLNVEEKYAANAAQSAKDWQRFEKEKDIFPNLTFRTMQDGNVRPHHAALEGMTKPVNDSLWSRYTPPIDPGCRCWLEQTVAPETPGAPDEKNNPQYGGNVGITGKPFTDKHSYFQVDKETRKTIQTYSESMKEYLPYNQVIELKEKKVLINDFADLGDLQQNISAAKKMAAELKKDIYIRPHFDGGIMKGQRSPEFGIGKISQHGDLKTFIKGNFSNFIDNSLKSANKQGAKYTILDISNYKDDGLINQLKRRLSGGITSEINRNIQNVVIINGEDVITITRKQIIQRDFAKLKSI